MKGIIMAGGLGTRLYPFTKYISKHLLPIYDKPLIYYPLAVLMKSNIQEILIITKKENLNDFKKILGDGTKIGINILYKIQEKPNGIAEAFLLGEGFIGNENVMLILGDNIFIGDNLEHKILKSCKKVDEGKYGAVIFAYEVTEPERYGVINFDKLGNAECIEEKPLNPKSNFCVTGLYIYNNKVIDYAKRLKPSKRNELEKTDINNIYLDKKNLHVEIIGNENYWFDAGTFESLYLANKKVRDMKIKGNMGIACIENIAHKKGWVSRMPLKKETFETVNSVENHIEMTQK